MSHKLNEQNRHSDNYKPVTSPIEKKMIRWTLQRLITRGRFHIDFSEHDTVLIDRGPHPIYPGKTFGIAPPGLASLLRILLEPDFRFLQSYMMGQWYPTRCNLTDLVLFFRSQRIDAFSFWQQCASNLNALFFIKKQYITSRLSTREARYNYNLTPDFYKLFLGKYMVYSCAFFDQKHKSLDRAQENKMVITAKRLQLTKGLRVLDIGCGWGELAQYLVREHAVQVTGISIAETQIVHAMQAAGNLPQTLTEQLSFRHIDYDQLEPDHCSAFDRVVSIGMAEHVGKKRLKDYFRAISSMLRPGGIAVIHSIVAEQATIPNRWIDKNIFPGGYIPVMSEFMAGIEAAPRLILAEIHFHPGENYAKTMASWSKLYVKNKSPIIEQLKLIIQNTEGLEKTIKSIDDLAIRQYRKWLAYLSCAETSFVAPDQKPNFVAQVVIRKDKN